jgi:hypothetical protein
MMKKLLLVTATLTAVAGPAFAQAKRDADPLEIIDREKKRQAEDNDRQYQRMMERTRQSGDTVSTRSDPWANMRAPSDGKR